LLDERKRDELRVGGSRKQGVFSSSIDVKLLQNIVAVDDVIKIVTKINEKRLKIIFTSNMYV